MAGVAGIDDINLWAPVNPDGSINQVGTPDNNREETKGTSKLGKDAFLNLLVAQMKYQDPLNPTSDTEWIAQMATFSTLEEMQNMNTTMGNSQALSLVGKTVLINSNDKLVGGKVDYVVMQGGKAYLAVNEKLYSIDDLDTVASEEYLKKLEEAGTVNKPEVDKPEEDKEEDKTDPDETDPDKEEDKTDAQKILDSLTGLGTKLDAMGDAITKAAESMVDAADVISGMADSREAASTREEAEHFVSGSSENKGTTENVVENTTTTGTVGTDIKAEEEETTENVETENSVEQNITTE